MSREPALQTGTVPGEVVGHLLDMDHFAARSTHEKVARATWEARGAGSGAVHVMTRPASTRSSTGHQDQQGSPSLGTVAGPQTMAGLREDMTTSSHLLLSFSPCLLGSEYKMITDNCHSIAMTNIDSGTNCLSLNPSSTP